MPQLVFRYANGRTRELENTNKVLKRLPYCNGMKTGYTEAAGHCLICSGTIPGRDVIVVVLGDSKVGRLAGRFRVAFLGSPADVICARRRRVDERTFEEQLEALRARSLHRKLREIGTPQGPEVRIVGRHLVNFSSNDYLGLAADPLLRTAAIAAIEEFGVGAGASRLISGTQSPHVVLETTLAEWKQAPAAICFSSGYAAAVGTMPRARLKT